MKKLYIITQSFCVNKGSFSGVIERLAKHAHGKGFKVVILCGYHGQKKINFEKVSFADIIRFRVKSAKIFGNLREAFYLSREVNKYFKNLTLDKSDLIFANGESSLGLKGLQFHLRAGDQPSWVFLKNMEIAKKETSLVSRVARVTHTFIQYLLERQYVPAAESISFASEETCNLFKKYYNCKKIPIFIPRSGIKKTKISGVKRDNNKILFSASNKEKIRKGVVYLEKALPKLFEKYPKISLVHVGDEIDWKIPEKHTNRIVSVGKVSWDKMQRYYLECGMIIHPSLSEGFPNVLLEAMAAGCPIATSDIQGVEEYLPHKERAYVFKRGSAIAITEAVSFLYENKKKAKAYAKNSKEFAKRLDNSIYYSELLKFMEDKKPKNLLKD